MNISIIEDEKILASGIAKKLEKNLYNTRVFNSISDFNFNGKNFKTDLYIIDLSLGDGSGFDLIKKLREKDQKSPIIIMSGYNDSEKKIYGLNIGADDYITKPFSPEELIARVRNITKRTYNINKVNVITYRHISFDLISKLVYNGEKIIQLRRKERQLIELFLLNIGRLITKDELTNYVWGDDEIGDNTLNSTLSKVRKKLGLRLSLKTSVNQGYILEKVR